ncbi:hypothetical protein FZD47_02565 [Bacillus infantis]|uniref:Uncharacterized protein n=1 Tax=Bacillus infantis TaxID=324767 RepID=A0A5D4STX7_9BACI|nr:hypothetical protein FZD47_02565 [Bacillus infantis]
MALEDNQSVINFYSNFEEFKSDNPDTQLNTEDYTGYFETGDAIKKILVIENVRLLRQFPTLDGAKMTLPFEGKTYSIDLNRKSVNDYLGFKVEDLSTEDDSWNEKFVDPIGYNEAKRNDFFDQFGVIK